MAEVVIVGGGIAGLASAYYLQQSSPDITITLLESSDRLGGKVSTLTDKGFLLEGGPDAVVRYKPWALELINELGLAEQIVGTVPSKPSALIHDGNQALAIPAGLQTVIPGDLKAIAMTSLLSPWAKARVLLDWIIPKGTPDDEAFGAFIQRRLGKEIWERLVAPLSGGIYGGDPYELSTLAAFPQLKQLEQVHHSLLRGAIQQRRERGSREGGQIFASLKNGLGDWVSVLQNRLSKATIHLNCPVQTLSRQRDTWCVHTSQGLIEADAVMLATPGPVTAQLLEVIQPTSAQALRKIPHGDSATVSLAFPIEALPKRVGHGMLMASKRGFSVRGFTWTDQKWQGRAPEGFALVRGYFSGVRAEQDELIRLALADLQTLWGRVPEVRHSWVSQWKEGLPQYTVGHLERVQQALSAEELPGLFLVGAAYQGVGLPEVVKMAKERAAKATTFLRN